MKKNHKRNIIVASISVLVIALLIIFVVVPYQKKIKAPTREDSSVERAADSGKINSNIIPNQTTTPSSDDTADSTTQSENFDTKGATASSTPTPVAINNDSTDPYYYYDLGRQEFAKNNCQEAINYFNKAIALNSTNPNFYIKKSETQIALGQKQDALNTINQGLEKLPDNDSLLLQLDFIKNVVK